MNQFQPFYSSAYSGLFLTSLIRRVTEEGYRSGELIGYGLRLFKGYLRDKTRLYWKITTIAQFINTTTVTLLVLTGGKQPLH